MDGRLRAAVNRAHASATQPTPPADPTAPLLNDQPATLHRPRIQPDRVTLEVDHTVTHRSPAANPRNRISRDEGRRGFQAAGRMNSYRPGRHRGLTSTWRRSVSWHCLYVCCKALPNVIVPSLRGVRTVGRDIEVGVSIPLRMRHVPGAGDPLLRDVVDETKAWETRQGGYECVPGRHPLGRRGPLR